MAENRTRRGGRSRVAVRRTYSSFDSGEASLSNFREILATFSFSINFLALGSFVIGLLALLGVLQGYQKCTMMASESHPETEGACLMLVDEVSVCEEWTCYLFSISLIVLAVILWAMQIPSIADWLGNSWWAWLGYAPLVIVMILVLVAACFMVTNESNAENDTSTASENVRRGNLGGLAFLWFGLAMLFVITHKQVVS